MLDNVLSSYDIRLTNRSANGQAVNGSNDIDSSPQTRQRETHPYSDFKRAALGEREQAQPGETPRMMRELYKFWSVLLLRDFNSNVYTQFRELALEDVARDVPARCGLKHLLGFYEKLLLDSDGDKPWPQGRAIPGIFQLHFQEALEIDRTLSARHDATI